MFVYIFSNSSFYRFFIVFQQLLNGKYDFMKQFVFLFDYLYCLASVSWNFIDKIEEKMKKCLKKTSDWINHLCDMTRSTPGKVQLHLLHSKQVLWVHLGRRQRALFFLAERFGQCSLPIDDRSILFSWFFIIIHWKCKCKWIEKERRRRESSRQS